MQSVTVEFESILNQRVILQVRTDTIFAKVFVIAYRLRALRLRISPVVEGQPTGRTVVLKQVRCPAALMRGLMRECPSGCRRPTMPSRRPCSSSGVRASGPLGGVQTSPAPRRVDGDVNSGTPPPHTVMVCRMPPVSSPQRKISRGRRRHAVSFQSNPSTLSIGHRALKRVCVRCTPSLVGERSCRGGLISLRIRGCVQPPWASQRPRNRQRAVVRSSRVRRSSQRTRRRTSWSSRWWTGRWRRRS